MSNLYYVYMLSNKETRPIYVGVTNDLLRRVYQHKHELNNSYTKRYKLKNLLYFEETIDISTAINREKQLKNWHRDWKLNLITTLNPTFIDLSKDWF